MLKKIKKYCDDIQVLCYYSIIIIFLAAYYIINNVNRKELKYPKNTHFCLS